MRLGEILVRDGAMGEEDVLAALDGREESERIGEAAHRAAAAAASVP